MSSYIATTQPNEDIQVDVYHSSKDAIQQAPLASLATLILVGLGVTWVFRGVYKELKQGLLPVMNKFIEANQSTLLDLKDKNARILDNSTRALESSKDIQAGVSKAEEKIVQKLEKVESDLDEIDAVLREIKNIISRSQ